MIKRVLRTLLATFLIVLLIETTPVLGISTIIPRVVETLLATPGFEVERQIGTDTWNDMFKQGVSCQAGGNNRVGYDTSLTYHAGMRFTNITIPQGASITAAYFKVYAVSSGFTGGITTKVCLRDADDTPLPSNCDFITVTSNHTDAYIQFVPSGWTVDAWWQSPDFKDAVQEVVDRQGWETGNAMFIVWRYVSPNTGVRAFRGYPNGNEPILHIEYEVPLMSDVADVEETSATLSGNVVSIEDTSITDRGFVWDTVSRYNPGNTSPASSNYTNYWTESGSWGTGTYNHGITGLVQGELYYARSVVKNNVPTWFYSSEMYFLTKPEAPTSFIATKIGLIQIDLTWVKGTGSYKTKIIRKVDSYPANMTDGDEIYFDSGISYSDTELMSGTHYYYRAWSYATEGGEEQYSDGYDQDESFTSTGTEVARQIFDSLYNDGNTEGGSCDMSGNVRVGRDAVMDFHAGLRFQNITLTREVTIIAAYLKVYTLPDDWSGSVLTRIYFYDADDVAQPSDCTLILDTGNHTAEYVEFSVGDWGDGGFWYQTPDFRDVVQEIVDRVGWNSGNSMYLIWQRTANAGAHDFRGYPNGNEAILYIEYVEPGFAVTTLAATNIGITSATLQGSLTDDGEESSSLRFVYGLTSSYGSSTPWESSYTTGDAYYETITGLLVDTQYHFRIEAKHADETTVHGVDRAFTTLSLDVPSVSTSSATEITSLSAKLQGTLDNLGNYSPVYVYFEYGQTVGYGATTVEQTRTDAGGFNQSISGLSSGITYHFRAVARYDSSYAYGSDRSFVATVAGEPGIDPPDILRIDDIKVFTGYLEGCCDQLYVISYRIVYTVGTPILDVSDYFDFQLLDGTTLKAQTPVKSWDYKPGSIYLTAASVPTWGGDYTIKIIGNPNRWESPPECYRNITPGDWQGSDLVQLDTWVISLAESLQSYYSSEMVVYTVSGTPVLSEQGGVIFSMGIPGLSTVRPHLFKARVEYAEYDKPEREDKLQPQLDPREKLGPYITDVVEEGGALVGQDLDTTVGWIFGLLYIFAAVLVGVFTGMWIVGFAVVAPIVLAGMWVGGIPVAGLMLFVSVVLLFILKASWLRGI